MKNNGKTLNRRATSYDVARLAGTSQSAVSRVFSPNGSASAAMRERILKAAGELNYRPNAIAQSLSRGRTRLVGMIATHYSQLYYPTVLKAMTGILGQTNDSLMLQVVENDLPADDAVARLLEYRVDAILCSAILTRKSALLCADEKVPLVLVNRRLDAPGVDHVLSDHYDSAHRVALGLATAGCVKTAYVAGTSHSHVGRLRCEGFLAGCRAAGLPEPLTIGGNFTYDGGHAAAVQLVDRHAGLDAIVTANDTMAMGVVDALVHDKGLRVPDDIMVVGHDGARMAGQKAYRLTTTFQPMEEMLKTAVKLAFLRRDDPDLPAAEFILKSRLIMRETARWPVADEREEVSAEPAPVAPA